LSIPRNDLTGLDGLIQAQIAKFASAGKAKNGLLGSPSIFCGESFWRFVWPDNWLTFSAPMDRLIINQSCFFASRQPWIASAAASVQSAIAKFRFYRLLAWACFLF